MSDIDDKLNETKESFLAEIDNSVTNIGLKWHPVSDCYQ